MASPESADAQDQPPPPLVAAAPKILTIGQGPPDDQTWSLMTLSLVALRVRRSGRAAMV